MSSGNWGQADAPKSAGSDGWGKPDAAATVSSWGAPPKVTDLGAKNGWPVGNAGAKDDVDSLTKGLGDMMSTAPASKEQEKDLVKRESRAEDESPENGAEKGDDENGDVEPAVQKHSNLVENAHDVEIKLADLEVEANKALYAGVATFEDLGLHENLLKGLYGMGFQKPSKIQEKALPLLLASPPRNMIGQSQSGTGKTAAFTLTMLSRVDFSLNAPQVICLAPARELARQIMDVVREMGKFTPVTTAFAIKDSIERGAKVNEHIVIGTPGTVMDLIKRRQLDVRNVRIFVLDEADNMIDQQGLGDQSLRIKK
ncbi:RNA helicase required for poly(A+) mRNA export [Phlyctochytrium bullatum]|nr:RNA helicase required for poly(A+) mRNA export [Phlyctochytrium bullatum]